MDFVLSDYLLKNHADICKNIYSMKWDVLLATVIEVQAKEIEKLKTNTCDDAREFRISG